MFYDILYRHNFCCSVKFNEINFFFFLVCATGTQTRYLIPLEDYAKHRSTCGNGCGTLSYILDLITTSRVAIVKSFSGKCSKYWPSCALCKKEKKKKKNIQCAGEKWKGCQVAAKFVSSPILLGIAFYHHITSLSNRGKHIINICLDVLKKWLQSCYISLRCLFFFPPFFHSCRLSLTFL